MPPKIKRPRSPSPSTPAESAEPASPHKSKKLKLLASHSLASPFPDFPHPTPTEAAQVHALLAAAHPDLSAHPRRPSAANDSARTCGSVPNVLESLIGTILSQNTSARNSTAAKRGLDAAFGRNDFAAIARAKREDVVEAIKTGGLANKKAGVIQKILQEVYERHGAYSLQHLAAVAEVPDVKGKIKAEASEPVSKVSDEEAMQELVSYDGVGPKTASCVLLFCLGRASFPVDTHVFRLSRLLGWVPQKADRVTAQAHLDLTIPNDLKYGLHVLMVGHGRRCKGCKGAGAKGECVLKKWLRESKGVKEEVLEAKIEDAEGLETIADEDPLAVKTED
ncbi:DNA glycosylase [Cubamyces sp. BRFM 1775]|nr:DNA glycosylase [Cubamyces sp. BRFM 1775]